MGWAQEGLDWAWDGHGRELPPPTSGYCLPFPHYSSLVGAWGAAWAAHALCMGCAWASAAPTHEWLPPAHPHGPRHGLRMDGWSWAGHEECWQRELPVECMRVHMHAH
jgi:hypothetical protein